MRLHANPSAAEIRTLDTCCDLYWHLTGLGRDIWRTPELFEHFGIAVVEPMGAGAVPVAPRRSIRDHYQQGGRRAGR